MTTLASIADFEAITGLVVAETSNEARVTRLLELASDAVLAGAGVQKITQDSYEERVRTHEGVGYLTQRPVMSVESVTLNGDTLTEGADYRWTTGGNGRPAQLIRQYGGLDARWSTFVGFPGFNRDTEQIIVNYTAGWDPIPGQIISIVVAMARAAFDNGGQAAPTTETVGPFTDSFDEVQSPTFALTEQAQATIAALCGVKGPTSVHIAQGTV